ncbi:MAG TPA: ester cyclase, partial [Candidatus Thermoplasmatota archaeon]|nr:ester cyclase [Candidatus Thermoplasmatota archaeon]
KREVVDAHDVDAVDRFFAADYRNDVPGRAPGRDGLKEAFRGFFVAFPDVGETVDVVLAEGDLVASRSTIRGTHAGDFLGVPASGRRVAFAIHEISRVADRRIVESWVTFDLAALLAGARRPAVAGAAPESS